MLEEEQRANFETRAAEEKVKYEKILKIYLASAQRKEWEASHPQPLKKQKTKSGADKPPL